jgi:three-Cys-motif partner protein
VRGGDFNQRSHEILRPSVIKETEATFCLLDQRTFECKWSTVEAIARHKKVGMKIEIFYFLANWWLDRGLAAAAGKQKVRDWWGRDDWTRLRDMDRFERVAAFEKRLIL